MKTADKNPLQATVGDILIGKRTSPAGNRRAVIGTQNPDYYGCDISDNTGSGFSFLRTVLWRNKELGKNWYKAAKGKTE
jgi:hypothetical protein